ncbi:MAG: hypothetical protein HQK57_17155, partial [Deltaproteobacteria bacterium]|nr:hypothetical protein [Deltaproteobacteria bacterium]
SLTSTISLSGYAPGPTAAVYRYSGAQPGAIVHATDQAVTAGGFTYTFPGNSITLFVLIPGTSRPTMGVWKAPTGKNLYLQTYTDGSAMCLISPDAKTILACYAKSLTNGVFDGGDVATGGKKQQLKITLTAADQAEYTLTDVASGKTESSIMTVDSPADVNTATDGVWQASPETSQMFYFQRYIGGGALLLLSNDGVTCEVYYDPAATATLFSGQDILKQGIHAGFVFTNAVSGQVSRETSDGKKTNWNVIRFSSAQ